MALIRNGSRLVRCCFVRCSMHARPLFALGIGKDGWSNTCYSCVFFHSFDLGYHTYTHAQRNTCAQFLIVHSSVGRSTHFV